MSATTTNTNIILFHYPFSPWAQKVRAYLAFRRIPYAECHAPVTMPRPDFETLGLKYRRIPVLAIGRDIYCDTIIMLEKLSELFGSEYGEDLVAPTGEQKLLEKLLEKWTDVVVFGKAAEVIPSQLEIMMDPNFQSDREELWGRSWKGNVQDQLRPAALVVLKDVFDLLDKTVLSDGRDWILNTPRPMLADIHAGWVITWLLDLPDALPASIFNPEKYPRTFAWRERYKAAFESAEASASKPEFLEGTQAIERIAKAEFADREVGVDEGDPVGLGKGERVEAWPVDTGFTRREVGELVGLTGQEIVVSSTMREGGAIRVHYPRWNFAVEAAGDANGVKEGANGVKV